ncbi:MAG: methyltransferase domain-containing protein [Xanthomonadales bacterium]|nr:methyltransferase domain-containing protein [Xanthomonadales bacterium]
MDNQKLDTFLAQMLNDLGGAFGIPLVRIGLNLGLYRTLRDEGPLTAAELARKTGFAERYLREWLAYNAASNYVEYDPASTRFTLPPEQAAVLDDEDSPTYMADAFNAAAAYIDNQPLVQEGFKTGQGVGWGDQSGCLSCAVARFFRPGYQANIVSDWLPALDGVVERLERGARVADVGCGHGYSTLIMAEAFPNSEFWGYDFHEESIADARAHAAQHGAPDNVRFEVAPAKGFPGQDYDLITTFDALHDMGDPAGAAAHAFQALKADGSWLIVEPFAHDRLEDNLNPVGRLYYGASTMVCVPTSLDQEVGTALGAQAGEARLRNVVTSCGFGSLTRATETPFNLILEARP